MDIPSYMRYIKDISVPVEDLNVIIRDVVADIAISTKIFKKPFGFTISKDISQYDFKSLFNLSVALEYDVTNLSIGIVIDDNGSEVLKTKTTMVNNNYQHTLLSVDDVILIYDKLNGKSGNKDFSMTSIFDKFLHLSGFIYQIKDTYFIGKEGQLDAIAIGSVIPDVDAISGDNERLIRPCVIAGLKYYVASSMMNTENMQMISMFKSNFENEKIRLQNTFNTVDAKQIKQSWI